MVFDDNLIASLQEGEEWIARLTKEAEILANDIIIAQNYLSDIGIASIAFSLGKTEEAIEQIKLEMMLLDE